MLGHFGASQVVVVEDIADAWCFWEWAPDTVFLGDLSVQFGYPCPFYPLHAQASKLGLEDFLC